MLWCRAASCLLAVWLGCWRLSQGCITRKEECEQMMEQALEMTSPEDRCSGMKEYVVCVQEDIADCTDNRFSDQYALNMEALHCSQAYLCSQKLQACYAKFYGFMQRTIQQSDPEERTRICRDLMTEIMTCQEEVTSQCQGQTGLMETVKKYQTALNLACNNTDPCVSMVLRCQKSIQDIGSDADTLNVTQRQALLSDCSSQKPIDYCGAYRQASACIRSGQSLCVGHLTVNNTLANLDRSSSELCDTVRTCSQKVSSCLCHINKQSLKGPVAIMTTICNTFPPFERCLDNLGADCEAHEQVRKEVTVLNATYHDYHELYCTRQGGLCPQALQCLAELPLETLAPSLPASASPFDITTLCSGATSVFRCLETAGTACQEEAGDVTFTQIEDTFFGMCSDIGPHKQKLTNCSSFQECLQDVDTAELGLPHSGEQNDVVRQMFAGLTKTSFWCRYLSHGFQCISKTAGACLVGDQLAAESIQRHRDMQRVCQRPVTTTKRPDGGVTVRPSKGNHGHSMLRSSPPWTMLLVLVIGVIPPDTVLIGHPRIFIVPLPCDQLKPPLFPPPPPHAPTRPPLALPSRVQCSGTSLVLSTPPSPPPTPPSTPAHPPTHPPHNHPGTQALHRIYFAISHPQCHSLN
ncbi:uncharacterized protein LOC143286510 isoform X2 [Babylonia areolata]|uniref:uncharacterized protein LOC143286510 isoform X2 n=1 Tax=Babylonia areolata TaxID=304850 RepID=UPI003FD2EBF3